MACESRFYRCNVCGNMVGLLRHGGGTLVCCGQPMEQLKANTTDAAQEKHVPAVTRSGDQLTVKIGSVPHPMTEEHHIEWIYILSEEGAQRHCLTVGKPAETIFTVGDGPVEVYEYCNLHGLWMTTVE